MLEVTQDEVRRHPRWREELRTPGHSTHVPRMAGWRLLAVVAVFIVVTALLVILMS